METKLLDPKKLKDAAKKYKALAHPMRLAIIQLLNNNEEELNVTSIYTKLGLEQAVASHHLTVLRNQGIVEFNRKGKNKVYTLKPDIIDSINDCLKKCGK